MTTEPTPLSPAAQAVLDAANSACCYGSDDILNDSRDIAVAALRTAASHVKASVSSAAPSTDWGDGWREGVLSTARGLFSIADELEKATQ